MKKTLFTISTLLAMSFGGIFIYFQYPSVLPFSKPTVLDFKSCNNNAYCTAQKLTKIKTFADYDSYLQHNNNFFDMFFNGIVRVFINFLPIDRLNINQSYCDGLQSGYSKESCNFAVMVRTSEVDCSSQAKNKAYEYPELSFTEYVDTNQICITEKVLAGQITDCSHYTGEESTTCQLALLTISTDEEQCSTILKNVTNFPETACSILFKIKNKQSFSLADCRGESSCYEFINLIRTYFTIEENSEICTIVPGDTKEICEETNTNLRAFNTNAINDCTNEKCIKDTISKMMYKNTITTKDDALCTKFINADLKSVCYETLYSDYAFYTLDPQYCPDFLCLAALRGNIPAEESYCTNLLFPIEDVDVKTELKNDCDKIVLPKLAAKDQDATLCESDYQCLKDTYAELIKQKNFSSKICATLKDEYAANDCQTTLNTAKAIANNNPNICENDSSCVRRYATSNYKNTLPCGSIIDNDSKLLCEDEVQFALHKNSITLTDCTNYHSPSFCLDAYFKNTEKDVIATLDHSVCTTFEAENAATCLQEISEAAGVYSGCNINESCIQTVYQATQNADCTNAGSWLPENEQKAAKDICIKFINKKEALLYKKVSSCPDEFCISSILTDIEKLEFPVEFIRKISLPTELLNVMFTDPFNDPLDLEKSFDATLIISKKDLLITREYLQSTTEVKSIVNDIYNQLDLTAQLQSCTQIDPSILDIFEISIQIQCKQLVSTRLAYALNNGNLCGTESCFKDFINKNPKSINCNSLSKKFRDTFNHESLQESCTAYTKSVLQ